MIFNREPREIRELDRMNTDASLIMGRLGGGGFDALELGGFDGLGKSLLEGGHFDELAGLFEDDLVELVVLMFQMGEVRFQLFDALGEFFVHAQILEHVPKLNSTLFMRKPHGRRCFWRQAALAHRLQPAAGMRAIRRLACHQNHLPQSAFKFRDKLLMVLCRKAKTVLS